MPGAFWPSFTRSSEIHRIQKHGGTELEQCPGPLIYLHLLRKEGILVGKERRKNKHQHMRADVWPVLSAPCVWAFKSLYVSPALSPAVATLCALLRLEARARPLNTPEGLGVVACVCRLCVSCCCSQGEEPLSATNYYARSTNRCTDRYF